MDAHLPALFGFTSLAMWGLLIWVFHALNT
uniref:Uncharacterized protein n=1 Tax=Physcomitrium patens TaxID=3218 RepID=A0A2K1KX69_PHYPA|nr:hypothetical protein PHYPA_005379 [Physcomitrium patens]